MGKEELQHQHTGGCQAMEGHPKVLPWPGGRTTGWEGGIGYSPRRIPAVSQLTWRNLVGV